MALAAQHPDNPLVQHRGQPSTHDVGLLAGVIQDLKLGRRTIAPTYDKSAFDGEGDRYPQASWQRFNEVDDESVAIILLEGWCVGFRPLDVRKLQSRWQHAVWCHEHEEYRGRLGANRYENIDFINTALDKYVQVFR